MASITGGRTASEAAVSHPYSCNTCQVAFRNNDLQKGHMKSDWHRYNLKRRVASLPPIASEVFAEKVLQARAETSAQAEKASFEHPCDVCQKTFYSENSYQNHLGSQKHKAKALAAARRKPEMAQPRADDEVSSVMSSTFSLGDPVAKNEVEGLDSDVEDEFNQVVEGLQKTNLKDARAGISPVKRPSKPHNAAQEQHKSDHPVSSASSSENPSADPTPSDSPALSKANGVGTDLTHCLFCNYASPTMPLNVHHMERIHGMFVPERKYLVDLAGLIDALQKRIQDRHECLYCGKSKANAFAVQTHMRDKGHCQIPYSTEADQLKIGEFYDFRSTYSDGEESETESDNVQNGGAKLGARRSVTTRNEDGDVIMSDESGEDGWETDSSASSLDSADLTAVPMEQHNYNQYERLDRHPHHSRDDPRAHHQLDGWHSHAHKHAHAVFYDEYELHLPSGKSVGHRSLNRYFRQNLHSHPSPAERQQMAIEAAAAEENDNSDAMSVDGVSQQVARQNGHGPSHSRAVVTRAHGGLGMVGVAEHKKQEAKRAEQRGRSLKEFSKKRNEWSVNKQANRQKFYNYQIL